jgi:predicted Zn-dependent peptidase
LEFLKETLSNGLQIVAERNDNAHSAALGFFVKTGSRDETDALWGVSHFLEHMLFKGTPRRTAADVNRELDEIGAEANAFTNEEQTVYHARVLPEYQERATDLLCDMMRPSLRADDFQMEKKVILEEIAKYEDQPPFGANDRVMADHFRNHPLGRCVLGTVDSVTALTPEQMREYFTRRYSPGNIVFSAAGKMDYDGLVRQVEALCGGWSPQAVTRETPANDASSGVVVVPNKIAVQEYGVAMSNGPAAEEDDVVRYGAALLTTILGDSSGSRMFWDLVESGRAEYAEMSPYEFQGAGVLMTFLCCAPEDVEDVLSGVSEIQLDAQENGVTAEELERAKNKVCSHVVLRSERPLTRMFDVGANWLQTCSYRSVRELVDIIRSVSRDDISNVLERFPLRDSTLVLVGPRTEVDWPRA